MQRIFAILIGAALYGCTAAEPAPPPVISTTSIEPFQTFRSAEFSIAAPDATACASRRASKLNLAQNFVIGDLESINRQYPRVPLSGTAGQPLFAVMSLLNSDDTLPQWIVTAEDIGDEHSIVELKNGADRTGNFAKFEQIWAAIEACDAAT